MKKRIILHIGSPKCGSTYLQNVLKQNSKSLARSGVFYPAPTSGHPGNGLEILELSEVQIKQWFTEGIETVVLSHEDLYATPGRGDRLKTLAENAGIDVQVVAFLRPFSEFIFGDYSQFMKQKFELYLQKRQPYEGRDFNAFVQYRVNTLKPAIFLKGWDNRSTSPIKIANHRNIRPVFEELLGPEAINDWDVHRDLTNPSLRMQDCDKLAEMILDPQKSNSEIRRFFKAAFAPNKTADLGRSPERIAHIEKAFEPQIKALQQTFGFDNSLNDTATLHRA